MSVIDGVSDNDIYPLLSQAAGIDEETKTRAPVEDEPSPVPDAEAYRLDLSPEALEYLDKAAGDRFALTKEQEETLARIVNRHKGAPFNQETFNLIQDELHEAGLSPEKLAQDDAEEVSTKINNYLQQIVSLWQTLAEKA